jgi:anti-sigma-K factor RskA
MTTQQLIEMAVLDALALLDDEERDDFERTFRAAKPQIQAHVRREQTRLSNIEAFLPDVEPPAGLRAAVIAALREEIAHPSSRRYADQPIPMLTARRVSPLWRAVAVGLGTAAVVLLGTFFYLNQQIRDIERQIDSFNTVVMLDNELGRELNSIVRDPQSRRVAFQTVNAENPGTAVLYVDPEKGKVYLLCDELPNYEEGRTYALFLVDGAGAETELARFSSNGGAYNHAEPMTFALAPDSVLMIKAANEQGRFDPMFATEKGAFASL